MTPPVATNAGTLWGLDPTPNNGYGVGGGYRSPAQLRTQNAAHAATSGSWSPWLVILIAVAAVVWL